jgi:hypothetical protein
VIAISVVFSIVRKPFFFSSSFQRFKPESTQDFFASTSHPASKAFSHRWVVF